jgi:multisubunit Na+/H+ antiporter MnhG subunit
MSIEQTSQLIQLIFNSVGMVVSCSLLLNGLLRRQIAESDRFLQLRQQYFDALTVSCGVRSQPLDQLKRSLHHFQYHDRLAAHSLLAIHYSLLLLLGSAFVTALRTMIGADVLITVALVLFTAGVGILFLAVGLTLRDLHFCQRSLQKEMRWLLSGQLDRPSKTVENTVANKSAVSIDVPELQTPQPEAQAKASRIRAS